MPRKAAHPLDFHFVVVLSTLSAPLSIVISTDLRSAAELAALTVADPTPLFQPVPHRMIRHTLPSDCPGPFPRIPVPEPRPDA